MFKCLNRKHPLSQFTIAVVAVLTLQVVVFGQPATQPAAPSPQDLAQVFGTEGQKDWQIPAPSKAAEYSIVEDASSRRRAIANSSVRPLTLRTEKNYGVGVEIRARFQLAAEAGKSASFTLSTGNGDPKETGFAFIVSAANNETQLATTRTTAARKSLSNGRFQVKAYPTVNPVGTRLCVHQLNMTWPRCRVLAGAGLRRRFS